MSRSLARVLLPLAAALCVATSSLAVGSEMHVVGGVSDAHAEVSADARRAALFAVDRLNHDAEKRTAALGSANGGEVTLLDITCVRTQVVAGVNYFLTLKLVDTSNEAPRLVQATVWARPWLENSNSGEAAWQLTDVKPA